MRYYYLSVLAVLVASSVAAMVVTYDVVLTLPQSSQTLAAGIILAFEGFAFGGAFQFVLEGRREQHRDRSSRIQRYHIKLKKHVIDYWSGKQVERRQLLGALPQSIENLYIDLTLGSLDDPDSRYLNDVARHLKDKRYEGVLELRQEIAAAVEVHNRKSSQLSAMTTDFVQRVKELGFTIVNLSPQDTLPTGSFNTAALRQYLEGPREPPDEGLSESSPGAPFLSYEDPWKTWRMMAVAYEGGELKALHATLTSFSKGYQQERRGVEASLATIQSKLSVFKNRALTIGYDIEEETFAGSCGFEARVNE